MCPDPNLKPEQAVVRPSISTQRPMSLVVCQPYGAICGKIVSLICKSWELGWTTAMTLAFDHRVAIVCFAW